MHAGPEEIARAVARLRAGGLVAFPTETVYGLGADAFNEHAVRRIFALKGRPSTNPLIVHVSGEEMAGEVVAGWPQSASRLAAAFWPGPLTIVLPRSSRIPSIITAGGNTVGVRCPDHPITLALLEALGGPLVGPSANPSGRVSPTTAEHVAESFSEEDVYILDGGPCTRGIESTVLLLSDHPRILRPGLITAEEISTILGQLVNEAAETEGSHQWPLPAGGEGKGSHSSSDAPAQSPGQHPLHYAPSTKAILFTADPPLRGRTIIISCSGRIFPGAAHHITLPADPHAYAARLYTALREADAAKPDLIAIESPPRQGSLWQAIWDRLRRATSA
jgi:L-threonylcarbamoyladenylate synthase